ncbi:MAG TPA: ribonucleoside triphosphate reductase [Candidatus Paceibacterota bacterium]
MFTHIMKRDGRVVPFDANKIQSAITKAGSSTGEFDAGVASTLAAEVVSLAGEMIASKLPTVEEIQDVAEEVLMRSSYHATAKAYVIYRDQHARLRELTNQAHVDLMDEYLKRLDWQVNENSNMGFSLQGLNNYVASEVSKVYWLNKIYPANIREAYLRGDFHIHDLNALSVYCVGWDLMDLLMEGFGGVTGKMESKPAKHFRSALGQVVNFFYTLQGEAAGAQAFSNFDTLLAPFIRYDKLSYADVKQALQEFVFNINVPTRVGFQTPFTNVTIDLQPPANLAGVPVIIGGVPQKELYRDFQAEIDMFNRAFLEVMLEGDAKGRVFTFPIPTYNITKDFDWDNPNLELLWQITAKYGIPYFSNFVNSDMKPEDARSMCCRLRLDTTQLEKRGGGLFGSHPLTGSVGVVTINMPRLGHISENEADFMSRLEGLMWLAKESLELKRKTIEHFTDADLYPYTKFYLRKMKEQFGCYWKNHFSTIGLVGMNEACMNLLGCSITDEEGHAFAMRVMDKMRSILVEYQRETGNNYNLEATPAEGTAYRLAKKDKERYPDIVCANEDAYKNGAAPFYTNSTHVPVNFTDDMFETLDAQDDLQVKYTGGTVIHLFVKERVKDMETVKNIVRTVCSTYRLPYFTITPTFSVCPVHGYRNGEEHTCTACGAKTEVYSRVVGYLRPVEQWNKGKKEEFKNRRTYMTSADTSDHHTNEHRRTRKMLSR